MKHPDPTHGRTKYLCMKCGHTFNRLVEDLDAAIMKPAECTKCGREARAFTLRGWLSIFQAMIREQERLRMKIFDLEAAEEQRAEPGIETG